MLLIRAFFIGLIMLAIASAFAFDALPARAQVYPRACLYQSQVIICPAAPTPVPTAGPAEQAIPNPPTGVWTSLFSVGDTQFYRYNMAVQYGSGTALVVAGWIQSLVNGSAIAVLTNSSTTGSLTLPTLPIGSNEVVALEVNPATQATAIVTAAGTSDPAPTTTAWHIVYEWVLAANTAAYTSSIAKLGHP